jgi:hypothetical protein
VIIGEPVITPSTSISVAPSMMALANSAASRTVVAVMVPTPSHLVEPDRSNADRRPSQSHACPGCAEPYPTNSDRSLWKA